MTLSANNLVYKRQAGRKLGGTGAALPNGCGWHALMGAPPFRVLAFVSADATPGTVVLQANTKYDIRLEYYRNATNPGTIKLEWQEFNPI